MNILNVLNRTAATLLLAGSVGSLCGEQIDYNGGGFYSYTGSATELTVNINGSTGGGQGDPAGIVRILNGATLNNPSGNALVVNYQSGDLHYYLSGVGATGTVNGNVAYTINGGAFNNQNVSSAITEAFIGTSYDKSAAVFNGDVSTTINGGTFNGNVFAGGGAIINGATKLIITGGTFLGQKNGSAAAVYGGGSWGGVINGDTTIEISGGDLSGTDLFGGSYTTYVNTFSQSVTTGSVSISITGGIFRDINGGGRDGKHGSGGYAKPGKIGGNTTISIDATNPVTVNGTINVTSGEVTGGGMVIFSGSATNLNFSGTVNTKSTDDPEYGGYGGTAVVQFGADGKAFTGQFNGAIADGFDALNITGSSSVDFAKSFTVGELVLDVRGGSTANLALGTSFDKLSLYLTGSFAVDDTVPLSLTDIFGGSSALVENLLANGSILTVYDSGNQEWLATYGSGDITIVQAIPEPSTYLLLGVAGLGLVLWRRRSTWSALR